MRTQRVGRLDLDEHALGEELRRSHDFLYSDAYSEYLCGGPWRSCMLWSVGGARGDGLVTNYDHQERTRKTPYGEQMPHLAAVVERSFNLEHLRFARLAVISNSVIIPHRDLLELDDVPAHARNAHRIHVPLVTSEHCYFSEDDTVYRMKFGEVWFFDSSVMHSAASFSPDWRVHLMLDFSDVTRGDELLRFPLGDGPGIPRDSICERPALGDEEHAQLMALARIVDVDNLRDVFGIVIKKHYRRDGGPDFVWRTMREIAGRSRNSAVMSKIDELYGYFMVKRSAVVMS